MLTNDLKIFNRVKNTTKTLVMGRKGYPPQVGKFISKNKDEIIRHIRVIRTPINGMIQKFLNKFGGKVDYDKLFHLRLQITTRTNKKFTIEKNEVIKVSKWRNDKGDDFMDVPKAFAVTVDDFLTNAERAMGDKYYIYSSKNSNCQDYCVGLLRSNGVTDQNVLGFIKQDTQAIFAGKPLLRKLANTLTDLGGKVADPIMQGGKINGKQNPWITHVKAYAKSHNVTYGEAMSLAGATYKR